MKIFFIVSLVIVVISFFIMILYNKLTNKKVTQTFLGGLSIFCFCFFAFVGLVMLPLLLEYKKEYIEIQNYNVVKNDHNIIIDLENSPQKNDVYIKIVKFNSHEIVETYNDSVKFYIEKGKSFYNMQTTTNVVWSKPPYKYYNYE